MKRSVKSCGKLSNLIKDAMSTSQFAPINPNIRIEKKTSPSKKYQPAPTYSNSRDELGKFILIEKEDEKEDKESTEEDRPYCYISPSASEESLFMYSDESEEEQESQEHNHTSMSFGAISDGIDSQTAYGGGLTLVRHDHEIAKGIDYI